MQSSSAEEQHEREAEQNSGAVQKSSTEKEQSEAKTKEENVNDEMWNGVQIAKRSNTRVASVEAEQEAFEERVIEECCVSKS